MKTLEFLFQSKAIHFLVNPNEKDVMVNATEMAKMFGKRTKDYLANQSTQILIKELERTVIISISNAENNNFAPSDVREQLTPNGGRLDYERTPISVRSDQKIIDNRGHMGIYFCEILALDFAAWLDVEFKIWIYQTIRDLLTAKNKKVATAVSKKQEQIDFRNKLLLQAEKDGNALALELLKSERDIKHFDYLQRKALTELRDQYEIKF